MIIKVNWKKTVLFLFSFSVLFPPGFGVRFSDSLPGVDIQRLSILFIFFIFPVYIFSRKNRKNRIKGKLFIHTKTEYSLLFIVLIQFLSIFTVNSPFGSLLWAVGNTLLYFGYAFIVVFILSNERITIMEFARVASVISVILLVWTILETIFQANIITYRNMYRAEVVELYSNLTRFWVMPIGPYVYVKALAMSLLLFGPIIYVYKKQYGHKSSFIWLWFFIISIISTQTISAILAMAVMMFLISIYYSWVIGGLVASTIVGALLIIYFLVPDSAQYFDSYLFEGRGSFGNRYEDLITLFINWFNSGHWLFGWGNGSVGDPDRVASSVYKGLTEDRTNPGSIFIWFIESGMFVGLLILSIFVRAVIFGLKSHNDVLIFLAASLSGFFVMMLSTINTKIFGPALVICGLIDFFTRKTYKHKV